MEIFFSDSRFAYLYRKLLFPDYKLLFFWLEIQLRIPYFNNRFIFLTIDFSLLARDANNNAAANDCIIEIWENVLQLSYSYLHSAVLGL